MSENNENNESQANGSQAAQNALNAAKQQGQQNIQNLANEGIKKGAAKIAGNAATGSATTGVLAAILPYLVAAGIVILALIIIIGIVAFLVTMPGMMSDKLKQFGQSIGDGIRSIFMKDAAVIHEEDIVDLAQYINGMGYDVLGYGFVTPKDTYTKIKLAETLEDEGYEREEFTYKIDDKEKNGVRYQKNGSYYNEMFYDHTGVLYNGLSGKAFNDIKGDKGEGNYRKYGIEYNGSGEIIDVSGVDVSYLKTYAISNRRIFVLRNENDDLLAKIFHKLYDFLANENYSSWANGLVHIYNAKDSLASGPYIDSVLNPKSWFDVVEYTSSGNLKLKNGITNSAMIFDTEGWTPRYGLSQDFLVSLHLATLAPDFVETLVQSYDTEVQVYLDTVDDAKAHVKMVDTSSSEIGTEETGFMIADFMDRFEDMELDIDDKSWFDLGIDLDAWHISKKEAARFYYLADMNSPSTCTNAYKAGIPDHEYKDLDTDDYKAGWINSDGEYVESERKSSYILLTEAAFKNNNDSDQYICEDSDPQLISYNIIERVKSFANMLARDQIYGFTTEDLENVNALMVDEENCATANAYNEVEPYDPHKDYGYFDYGNENYSTSFNYPSIYLSPNSNGLEIERFLRETGYITDDSLSELMIINDFGEEKYAINTGINVYDLDGYVWNNNGGSSSGIGSTCFFEYGKIYKKVEETDSGEDFSLGNPIRYSGEFCHCDFCENFWNKYYTLFLVTKDISFSDTVKDDLLKYIDEDEKNPETGFKEYVSDIYTWDYTNDYGEIIQYNISFYVTDYDGNFEVMLALTRSWTEDEIQAIKDKIENNEDTCSYQIKECDSLEEAEDYKVCSQCRKYVKYLVKSLKAVNDESYSTYVPYIARVIDSWFRDTYFIIPTSYEQDFQDEDGDWHDEEAAIKDAIEDHGYKPEELTGNGVSIIENDSEFLDVTGELWTKYMMNINGDSYAVFLLDTTGELLKSEDDVLEYLDKIKISRNISDEDMNLIKQKYVEFDEYVYENTSGWGRWKGEDNDLTDEEKEKAEELLEEYDISLVKIPVTKKIKDLDSNSASKGISWSAYTGSMDNGAVWQDIEINDDSPRALRIVKRNYVPHNESTLTFKVGLDGVFNIVQTEDAQRGITNSKIKYLFKNKKYYKYDGTVERTYAIYDDWEACIDRFSIGNAFLNDPAVTLKNIGSSVTRQLLRPTAFSFWVNNESVSKEVRNLKETGLNSFIDAFYYQADSSILDNLKEVFFGNSTFEFARDFDDDGIAEVASLDYKIGDTGTGDDGTKLKITEATKLTNDPRNPELISNIDLTTESLAAFSILENTKTLDADYAYRDLKELFCELDYFDKEDLTEPPTEVMEWVLPNSGSYGYPKRMYDKTDEYGTLIHSKEMYENLNDLWLNGINGASSVIAGNEETPSGGPESSDTYVEPTGPIEVENTENSNDAEIDDEEALIKSNKFADSLLAVSSRNNSLVEIDPVDEVKYTSYFEKGYTVVVNVNGVEYKSYKQGSGAYYANYSIPPFVANRSTDCMATDACGITSTAIVLSAYGDESDPWDLAQEVANTYMYCFSDLRGIAKNHDVEFGTEVLVQSDSDIASAASELRKAFSEGKPAIILVGAGSDNRWTSGGHYMVAIGEMGGNLVLINCGNAEYAGFIDTGMSIEAFFKEYMVYRAGKNDYGKGFMVPTDAPSGFYTIAGENSFEGYEKYEPIVAPATAKILEIGIVDVGNENTDTILSKLYVSGEDVKDNSVDEKSEKGIISTFVDEAQYKAMEAAAQLKEKAADIAFGKEYKTGYIKLEVIGSESMEKFKKLKKNGYITQETYEAFEAYYEDYYKNDNKKSICDSYTIYIQGIDLTGFLEQGVGFSNIDDLIIGKIFNENAPDGAGTLAESVNSKGVVITNDDTVRGKNPSNSATSSLNNINVETEKRGNLEIYANDDNLLAVSSRANTGNSANNPDDEVNSPNNEASSSNNGVSSSNNSSSSSGNVKPSETILWQPSDSITSQKSNENDLFGTLINLNVGENGEEKEYKINYYTRRKAPEYYVDSAKKEIIENENKKDKLGAIIKIDKEIYLKAGTLIGLTGDANIKIVMKNKDESVVENVEHYLEIDDNSVRKSVSQSENYSVVGTVFSKSEWTVTTLEYTSKNPGDGVFNDENNLNEFYQICVDNGVNPEYAFLRAIHESSLACINNNNNYWGVDTPNGAAQVAAFETWQKGLERFCEVVTGYQDPTTDNYKVIMERYEERSKCTDFGGCNPNGYGKPDTIQGISSRYSWIGDTHQGTDPSAGGMYFLYPWRWIGTSMYEGKNKIIFESKEEFEERCRKCSWNYRWRAKFCTNHCLGTECIYSLAS